jgi:long-chain acyl-CoA synthetase
MTSISAAPDSLTLPQLLQQRASATPDRVAMREKEFGIWRELTWAEVAAQVRDASLGLLELGVKRGDMVAILADNIPEWPILELAAQSIGAVSCGIYASSVTEEVFYLLDYYAAVVVLAENQEQVDKVVGLRDRLPRLRKLVFEDPRGMRDYLEDDWFMEWTGLLERGHARHQRRPDEYAEHVARGQPDDVCHLSTTSGTTGRPKAAMLTHRNYVSMVQALVEVDPVREGDDYISFLPFPWIVEQVFGLALPLVTGMVVNFPESAETAMADLKEIGPHMMLGAPRIWEGIQSQIWVKIAETYRVNRWVYTQFMNLGRRAAEHRMRGRKLPAPLRVAAWVAELGLYGPLKDQLGLLRLRRAYTGGAALGPDTFSFFHGLGINLKQVYGQTETSGLAYVQRDGDIRPDTVGLPLPGVEVRISEQGEILTRCSGVCRGYHQRPEEFAACLDEDGWLRSGDAGYVDSDGHLVVIDRLAEVMRTAAGHVFSPQFIENKLKFSPFIKEAVVNGEGREFLTAMVSIDPFTVGKWAEERGIGYTTYADLSQQPAVRELVRTEVRRVNDELKAPERIRRFVLLPKLLDADDEELTRTGKVRRGFVAERYQAVTTALDDGDSDSVRILSEFRYQDGQTTTLDARIAILETGSTVVRHAPDKPERVVAS